MKILIISHEYPPVGGGGANACKSLAHAFAAAGNVVHVLSVKYKETPAEETLHDGRLRITRVAARRGFRDYCSAYEMLDYLVKASEEADKILEKESFDICLCFFGIPGGILARRLRRKYGLSYIVRMGGGDIPGFQDRFRLLYKIAGPELRRVWRDADALVANSEGLRQMAMKFCDSYPVRVISNGVDAEMYSPAETDTCSADERSARLLTVCRLIGRKGIQDLIPAIRRTEERTGRSIHWVIAGDGPCRQALERMAQECGADVNIEFCGHVEKEDMPELYRQADIFVFPSHREGMPNAVLEAMASGLPIIMREECQGSAELIRGNGLLAGDVFEDALSEMIESGKDAWREMGTASRDIVNRSYTWKQISAKYLELLEKILS